MRKHDNPGRPNSASLRQTAPPEGYPYLPAACPHGLIRLRIYRPLPQRNPSTPPVTSISRRSPPMQLIRQLQPSYDDATNATPPRYESLFLSYERSCTPLSAMQPPSPNSQAHPSRRNPSSPLSPSIPLHPTPTLHMCQLRPSYDHSTNSTPLRYESRFFSYESVECVDANTPNIPAANHDEIRQPRPDPQISPRGTVWSNTSQLRQWNEWNASQIRIALSQLQTESHALSGMAPSLTQSPAPFAPIQHDETRPCQRFSAGHHTPDIHPAPGPSHKAERSCYGCVPPSLKAQYPCDTLLSTYQTIPVCAP